jgi:hypothetical protein
MDTTEHITCGRCSSSGGTSACGYRKFKICLNGDAPPAIVTEIVAEMIALALGNVREQACPGTLAHFSVSKYATRRPPSVLLQAARRS